MARSRADAALSRAIKDSLRTYNAGNSRFFDYFAKDARIYTVDDSTKPIVGRDAFRRSFGRTLESVKRRAEVLTTDLQVHDGQAIQAQTLQVASQGVTTHVRQTVVWNKDEEGNWQITHLHNAVIGQPVVDASLLNKGDPVRVINERIATVAAAVGVAQ